MDNYLQYRWPKDGAQNGIPVMPPPKKKKDRKVLHIVLLVVLWVALLALICFTAFQIGHLVGRIVGSMQSLPSAGGGNNPGYTETVPPSFSPDDMEPYGPDEIDPGWTVEMLPWDKPNPDLQLECGAAGEAMLPRDIYQSCLPGVVRVVTEHTYSYATGSGFVVDPSGYILTNYHVIEGGTNIQVSMLTDLTYNYDAKVVGFDQEFDLAVLKIEARNLPTLSLGDSDTLQVGDPVYAIGNPMGYLTGSMSDGIVSALDREDTENTSSMAKIQTTAPLNGGNSGGPLLNEMGQVVGIVSSKITGIEDDKVIEGLGLALPISDLMPFINRILATGESWRPYMGITCYAGTYESRPGIIVSEVTPGVPASDAGLRSGDFIWAANGQRVTSLASLRRVLYRTGVGGTVTVNLKRGFDEMVISFTLIDSSEVPS